MGGCPVGGCLVRGCQMIFSNSPPSVSEHLALYWRSSTMACKELEKHYCINGL